MAKAPQADRDETGVASRPTRRERSASVEGARRDDLARIASRSVLDRMLLALRLGRRPSLWTNR